MTLTNDEKEKALLDAGWKKVTSESKEGITVGWQICLETGWSWVDCEGPFAQAIYDKACQPKRTWAEEPWVCKVNQTPGLQDHGVLVTAEGGYSVVCSLENYKRVAFCVNALAGITAEKPEDVQAFIQAALTASETPPSTMESTEAWQVVRAKSKAIRTVG